ncbi:MAG: STAS domain-containing protein [Planctomycetes bacterium]|nr:STAS domain-containing protein [Planctomycetota bacterium]
MAEAVKDSLFVILQRFANDLISSWLPSSPMGRLLRDARADSNVRAGLLGAPGDVLARYGVALPAATGIQFLENSDSAAHLVLPSQARIDAVKPQPARQRINPIKALIIESCYNPGLRQRLMAEAPSVLVQRGMAIPPGTEVRAHENTPQKLYVLIPAPERPEVMEMRRRIAPGKIADAPAEIQLEWREPGYLIVGGTADSATVDPFRKELDRVSIDLDIDLGKVKFFSSQGIGLLVRTQKRMALLGCRVRFINVPENVLKVLSIFRLLDVFEVEDHSRGDVMRLYHPA